MRAWRESSFSSALASSSLSFDLMECTRPELPVSTSEKKGGRNVDSHHISESRPFVFALLWSKKILCWTIVLGTVCKCCYYLSFKLGVACYSTLDNCNRCQQEQCHALVLNSMMQMYWFVLPLDNWPSSILCEKYSYSSGGLQICSTDISPLSSMVVTFI